MYFNFFLTFKVCFLAVFIILCGTAFAQTDALPDTENCLICHRYPLMGRYDEGGKKRIFYVNDKLFAKSVHGQLRCLNCHKGLDVIPHTDVKKVDCATKCHIKEPSTNIEFSHSNMIKKYRLSVHGEGTTEHPKPHPEDLPTCKYCHNNRIYERYAGENNNSIALATETISRCVGCHTSTEWAERFYSHVSHRMKDRRSQEEVITLCTSCHENREKMARHGLESIETFKDTFHWTLVKYNVKNAPDCLSCHVPVGSSTHDIRNRNDPVAPINALNRTKTCSNQGGVRICHPGATIQFASGRVHSYGVKAQAMAKVATKKHEEISEPIIIERAKNELSEKEILQYKILSWIRIFYKILIALVIGGMSLHQMLDYYRSKKRHKIEH